MADLDEVAESLLDTTADSGLKEEADDSVLSEIANDSVVEDAEDPVSSEVKFVLKCLEF